MPTLFRMAVLMGIVFGCCWGVAYAMATFLTPPQRQIEQVVALPQSANLTTGRSAAETLASEASRLVRRHKHH